MSLARYSRQTAHDQIGREGQERLSAGRVTIVGCGALGTVSASLLVRAGVGLVRIIDRDFDELPSRQRLYATDTDNLTSEFIPHMSDDSAVRNDYSI